MDRTVTSSAQDIDPDEAAEIGRLMKHEANRKMFVDEAEALQPGPASERALGALQEAYDNLSQSVRFAKKVCRELGALSPAHADVVGHALRTKVTRAALLQRRGSLFFDLASQANYGFTSFAVYYCF